MANKLTKNISSWLHIIPIHILIASAILVSWFFIYDFNIIQSAYAINKKLQKEITADNTNYQQINSKYKICSIDKAQINQHTQTLWTSYFNAMTTTNQSEKPNNKIDTFIQKNHLSIEKYQPIASDNNQTMLYRSCGTYSSILKTIANWNKNIFLAWPREILIEQCPRSHNLLQLTLLLER
jgi:hypothetical protein